MRLIEGETKELEFDAVVKVELVERSKDVVGM